MVGVFDSGVGGLSVWGELKKVVTNHRFIYVSDNAYCPYGSKSKEELIDRAEKITDFLIEKGAAVIVLACNTVTAATISCLREKYPIPFVGIEPALKPAAIQSSTKKVGVLATANTLKGDLYNSTLERFASDVEVIEVVGEGLVELVENGEFKGENVRQLLKKHIDPMIAQSVDSLVLGCTHYPFLKEEMRSLYGDTITIIDPAPAVAKQTLYIIERDKIPPDAKNEERTDTIFYATAEVDSLKRVIDYFYGDSQQYTFRHINI